MTETLNTSKSENRVIKRELFDDFERLANCSQDAIYHYEINSRRFLFYNQKFRTFFRLKNRVEITTTLDQILKFIHPEDRKQTLNVLNQSLKAGHTEGEVEYRVLYPDGSIRWLHDRWIVLKDQEGEPLAVQGFIRDNTQRKLCDLQFVESKQNSLIGSYITQAGRFQYVNPQFISITGYTKEELIDTYSINLVREDYRNQVRKSAVAMLKGESLTPYEFRILDKSGSTHWIMETVTSVIYMGERAVLGYFMDITDLHKMKDNLSALGLMIGTISHSLRGCLTGLDASLYLIETGFYRNKPARIEEGLDVTKLMADRIRKLIFDILYYSKARKLEIEKIKVWQFAKEVATQIETRIKAADIQFMTRFSQDSGYFSIDSGIISAALINILENAMEACIYDIRDINHWIHFTTSFDEENIYFEISDNGPGIEKEQAGKIFQLFGSSKGKRGTGMGLFVTRKSILKHGGTITVDSSHNKGTTFKITLPRTPHTQSQD